MLYQKPREIAVKVLLPSQEFIEDKLERELANIDISDADRRLIWEIACGARRWQILLDWLIKRKMKIPPRKPALLAILRVGLYQIFFLDKVPDHAAVNESVELATAFNLQQYKGLINAVLRAYVREKVSTFDLIAEIKEKQPHIGYAHPEWLYKRWVDNFGENNTRRLMDWNNTPPKIYARVNTLKITPEKLIELWKIEGVEFGPCSFDWVAENIVFEIKNPASIRNAPSFLQGLFYIQDPSTLLAVKVLAPGPGERILDMCSAPGGKTTYIAQLMNNSGTIIALDTSEERLIKVRENLARLGVTCCNASIYKKDNTHFQQDFDKVLVDAPCSNTGVLRRRVDLRHRIKPEEILRLQQTQIELLAIARTAVKIGGCIVYSTCSIEPEENIKVVEKFLSENPDWRLDHQQELLPFKDNVDGAYVARLIRH